MSESGEINPELIRLMNHMICKLEDVENNNHSEQTSSDDDKQKEHFAKLLEKLTIPKTIFSNYNTNSTTDSNVTDLNNNHLIVDENNNYIANGNVDQNNNYIEDETVDQVVEDNETIQEVNAFRILESNQMSYTIPNSCVLYSNELFEIIFDTPTPRPHLIIKHNSKLKDSQLINKSIKMFTKQEMISLFNLINEFMANYLKDVNTVTLSFHTGCWASRNHFHAHLCMETQDYINLFRRYRIIGPIMPTPKWLVSDPKLSTKEVYLLNVRNYERMTRQESNNFRKREINQIINQADENISLDIIMERNNFARFQERFKSVHISFEVNEPKLKFKTFVGSNYVFLLQSLCVYADENGYFRNPNGCHLCIDISHPIKNLTQITEGYLRLSADRYYNINPSPLDFLNSFKNNSNYYINT